MEGSNTSILEVCVVLPNTEYLFRSVCVDKDVLHIGLLYGLDISKNKLNWVESNNIKTSCHLSAWESRTLALRCS